MHRSALAAAAVVAVCLTACDRSSGPTAPQPERIEQALTQTQESQHIVFRFAPGDGVSAENQEEFHRWATGLLGVALPVKLRYYKYNGRGEIQRLTGRATNGFAEPESFIVHSIWPYDPHEAVHVYSALVGRPPDSFNEGLAVALAVDPLRGDFTPLWNNQPVHEVARGLKASGQLAALASWVETAAFRRVPEQQGYPQAGSFVLQLIDTRGIGPLLQFFAASRRDDSLGALRASFQAAYGVTLEDAEGRWLEFLG
jgi:hypothetical protein